MSPSGPYSFRISCAMFLNENFIPILYNLSKIAGDNTSGDNIFVPVFKSHIPITFKSTGSLSKKTNVLSCIVFCCCVQLFFVSYFSTSSTNLTHSSLQ